jgi:two-component system CheB/CheR fusion protein
LIEDHEDTAAYIRKYFERLGHGVVIARSCSEVEKLEDLTRFDLILGDIGLPDVNGWDLMAKIRAYTPAYAIAMSGFGSAADIRRSLRVGYHDHLVKPFTPALLEAALNKMPAPAA